MKTEKRPSTTAAIFCIAFVFAMSTLSMATKYPDTVWVKATFYDFKANGSNPNFEACNPGYQPGMIQTYLDSWRKPVFKANLACNDRIGEWFRASGQNGPDTPATQFVFDQVKMEWKWTGLVNYAPGGVVRPFEWVGPHHNDNYAMTDIIIYDSLPFILIDSVRGMYQYNNQSFFLLDGKGYGAEGKKDNAGNLHNFSFTMEIHTFFTYNGGEVFRFTGDDDVWAFINGQLAMDIGGVHSARSDSIILDNAAAKLNLVKGKTYPFDFFYAERHTTASTIRITTDIFKPRPAQIIVRPDTLPFNPKDTTVNLKDTTLTAGQCVKFNLYILNDTLGLEQKYDSLIQWEIFDTLGNEISFDTVSDQNRICVTKAYGCIKIRLTFRDPEDATNVIRDSIQLCVHQGAAQHLDIEASQDVNASPRNDDPMAGLTIPAAVVKDTVYAVLRDAYGNFVSPSQHTVWSVLSGANIVSVTNGNTGLGAGVISKLGPTGDAWIVAKSADYSGPQFCDTLRVVVSDIAYDSLRIVTGQGGQTTKISSLALTIGQDSIVRLQGHRIDGLGDHGWTAVSGAWSQSAALKSQTPPPASDSMWNFTPTDTGHGMIFARLAGIACSVSVWVKPGGPATMALYPNEGLPGGQYGNAPYLSSITYTFQAGTAVPCAAKLFDQINVWLSAYETDPLLSAQISWTARDSTGAAISSAMGSLSSQTGCRVFFTPKMAFKTYTLTATYNQGAILLQSSMHIRVTAGAPSHIDIEASPDSVTSPNADDPITTLEVQSTQTSQTVFAVLRDRYGNYIGHADSATWTSTDSTSVSVAKGPNVVLGQATITRISTTNGQSWVIAVLGTMSDSVDVLVTSITYDSVKIMVNSNGLRDIDTLVLRTDQDTTLYASGKRSDTKNWTSIAVAWQTITVATTPPSPSLASSFTFKPQAPANGKIAISRTGTGNILVTDTITALFLPGIAQRLDLYSKPGQPSAANKYPDPTVTDTVTAGTALPLYAEIFDQNNVWLSEYENNPGPMTWRIQELAGNPPSGVLTVNQIPSSATFVPRRAYNTLYVVAELGTNGALISDMVKIYVKPSAADHVVIESSPNAASSPNADNPVGTIAFGPMDTLKYAYAVLRDQYGNFVGPFTQALWQSADISLVNSQSGIAGLGEGMIVRKGNAGATSVIVHNADFTLADTASILLNTITYDSLRIVTPDNAPIGALSVRIDQDTTILVQGKRSDNHQWEFVAVDWKLIGQISTSPSAPLSSSIWTFEPRDTGSGLIVVSMGQAAPTTPDTIRISFTVGLAAKLVLYPSDTASPVPLSGPLTAIAVPAGDTFAMTARVLDNNNNWLTRYKSVSAPIFWRVEQRMSNPPTDSLTETVGYKSAFVSGRACNSVYVIATLVDSMKNHFYDTVLISVTPGPGNHLTLEPNPNWQVSPNRDNPADSITITGGSTFGRVYAVIRDAYGNFVSYSVHTAWTSADTSVASVENGSASIGEGVVRREAAQGRTIVRATDKDNPQLSGSVTVIVVNYSYEALRIVVRDSTHLSVLSMTTNDDTTLSAQGLRSDNGQWENASGKWEISSNLMTLPPPPDMAHSWTFYPSVAGSGIVRVSLAGDEVVLSDSVRVTFTAGPPNLIQFTIITPPDKRIAGDTIMAVVKIQNRTGLVPGVYCYSSDSANGQAVYQTLLGNGSKPPATITVDNAASLLNKYPGDSIKQNQCFENGLDTVRIVMFNAPFSKDSLQQLFVTLHGLKAASESFILLPAACAAIRLEDVLGNDLGDSLTLHAPDGSKTICAVGYDKFGNKLQTPEYCNWSVSGTLHPITGNSLAQRIYYEASSSVNNEAGRITAVAPDTSRGVMSDNVFVRIIGPAPKLVSAVTKDANGNGYLDRIVLTFDRKVAVPYSAQINVWYGSAAFTVDSILPKPSDSSSVVTVFIAEQKNGVPQSAWRPSCSIRNVLDLDPIDSVECIDGAGPVVWSVVKNITDASDRTQDMVTVVFSEPIAFANGNALSVSLSPQKTFDVWTRDFTADTLERLAGFLNGITTLAVILDSRTIQFYMANGNDLTDRHYLSIRTDTAAIADASPRYNTAVDTNQRVPVIIRADIPDRLIIAPNPSAPTLREEAAGVLHCANNPLARNWVRSDRAGVLMTFKIMPLSGSNEKFNGHLKIYDAIGNLVNYADNDDVIPSGWRTSGTTVHDMDIYWNGTNQKGMLVAPGLYRVFLYLDSGPNKRKLAGTIGIAR
jgi:fibro-slime domain-containing protein